MDEQSEYIVYEFGSFRADVLRRQLFAQGEPLPVTPKAFQTLLMLIRHRGATVLKTDLLDAIWADTAVEENNLTQQISTLRKILGEHPKDHKFIVTVPGRGYSFIADVKEISAPEPADVVLQALTTTNVTIDIFADKEKQAAGRDWAEPFALGAAAALTAALLMVIAAISWLNLGTIYRVPRTMAVLSFESLGGRDDSLGVGIRDTLTAKLGNLQELNIRPTNPTTKYAGQDPVMAGRELHVDAIVDGSVQHYGEQVRVTVRITDVAGGRVIWGKSFDKGDSDAFVMQDSISAEVAQVMHTRLNQSRPELW